ncbi:FAD-binding oxidoreductase [Nonomuraea soli]|uniref:FAD/FMN-containing dehydrogenase n=1 Tax=Nonomuraea soli TaxID=1032476 RepID=A0A7W0CNB4_9ACTN|nr:FAD-dependent oxidoreductase [Nonomuraea soli]MBA2894358.1 FAD/FMN-containing dehydrogenase [Nonomuraea soli]
MRDFTGSVHRPGDAGYDEARRAWNRAVDPRPALVAEALTPQDVRCAVLEARTKEMPLTVQATGHGTLADVPGALLLRTGDLDHVFVDPFRREVSVGAGAVWSDVIAAAAPYGLAPLSGTPWIGVSGYTLGGGAGYLSRKYGLAADSLLGATIVTADGELVEARDELLWALKGGSGNFGVVTELTLRLFPAERVVAGRSFHPGERAQEVLAAFEELEQPDELNAAVLLMPGMVGLRVLAVEGGERALAPLLKAAGDPLRGGFAEMSFQEAGDVLGPRHDPAPVAHGFELFHRLPPLEGVFGEVRRWGGAMAHGEGPAGHRDVPFSVISSEPVDLPGRTGGAFLNFLVDTSRTADAYTRADYERLVELKKLHDPDNLFRPSHLIGS